MAWLPQTRCYIWGSTDRLWKAADWKWSECALVQEIMLGVDATGLLPPWMVQEEEKKLVEAQEPIPASWIAKRKKFVEITCKIKGKSYNEQKNVNENIKITIDDVKLVLREVVGVKLEIKKDN